MTYTKAHNISYEDFKSGTNVYTFDGTSYTAKGTGEPAANIAYYYSTDGTNYIYCVILPQQTNPTTGDRLKVIDTAADKLLCTSSAKAVKGMTYFDKYTQNNGVYYAKVIKVQ